MVAERGKGELKLRIEALAWSGSGSHWVAMAEPSWQELLRLRLIERDATESSFSSVIEQCPSFSPFPLPL